MARNSGFNRDVQLTGNDKRLFLQVSNRVSFPTGSVIPRADDDGRKWFYILLNGMVMERFVDEENEQINGFYCENEFFGWHVETINKKQITYQAMEPILVYRIYRDQWEALQVLSPAIKNLWLHLMENQVQHEIEWQTIFSGMRAADLFRFLQRQKPALWRKARLQTVITALCH